MVYLGIDVAKSKLDCALLVQPERLKVKSKKVANTHEGLVELIVWCKKQSLSAIADWHAILEATGIYHELAALTLVEAGFTVSVVNPTQVKDFARGLAVRTKTDASDSVVLARYGAMVRPAAWRPPSPEIRTLKALLTQLEAIEATLRREQNRQEKAHCVSLPDVVRESFLLIQKSLRTEQTRLQQAIRDHVAQHPALQTDYAYLRSIPAVGDKTACRMLALLHGHTFRNAEQVAAYLGLVPVEHQSGTSIHRRARLSKAGDTRTRSILYMAAITAVHNNPHIRALYQRLLARGKSKMAALGAAMRKLVHLCFGVLKHQLPYQADWVVKAH